MMSRGRADSSSAYQQTRTYRAVRPRRRSSITGLGDGARRGSAAILQYPLLLLIFLIVVLELGLYVMLRFCVAFYETLVKKIRFRKQHDIMRNATSFREWSQAARELDILEKRESWK